MYNSFVNKYVSIVNNNKTRFATYTNRTMFIIATAPCGN